MAVLTGPRLGPFAVTGRGAEVLLRAASSPGEAPMSCCAPGLHRERRRVPSASRGIPGGIGGGGAESGDRRGGTRCASRIAAAHRPGTGRFGLRAFRWALGTGRFGFRALRWAAGAGRFGLRALRWALGTGRFANRASTRVPETPLAGATSRRRAPSAPDRGRSRGPCRRPATDRVARALPRRPGGGGPARGTRDRRRRHRRSRWGSPMAGRAATIRGDANAR